MITIKANNIFKKYKITFRKISLKIRQIIKYDRALCLRSDY